MSESTKKIVSNSQEVISSWFFIMLNKEIKKIVLETYKPNITLYTKYLMQIDDNYQVVSLETNFGEIKVIFNPEMEELIKLEVE
jgi:hypothetical protein